MTRPLFLLTLLALACSPGAAPERALGKVDTLDADRVFARAPSFRQDLTFIDAHMHCGAARAAKDACKVSETWEALEAQGGAGVIASLEHWTVNMRPEALATVRKLNPQSADFERNNEVYLRTAQAWGHVETFISLECWHDTAFGPGWVEACKEDARSWVRQGAVGFKDHIGRSADNEEDPVVSDVGVFAGGWSRRAGVCPESMSNKACVRQETVVYPALSSEWREVLRYLVEDLKAPVLTHATTYAGAPGECWDPLTQGLVRCPEMSRRHAVALAEWLEKNVSAEARRRVIVAHTGFMIPGAQDVTPAEADAMVAQLRALLSAGVSVDTAATKDFVAFAASERFGACALRTLFADFPEQFVFGTDRRVDNKGCLRGTYQLWEDLLTGALDKKGPVRETCVGETGTFGTGLKEEVVPGCSARVPPGTLERILRGNFEAMYQSGSLP